MKFATVWMLAAAALACAGCKKNAPAAADEAAAPAAEPVAVEAPADLALPAAADEAAPAVDVVEPALSEAEAAVVVAKVNGKDITEGEVQKVMRLFKKQMGARVPPDQMEAALPKIRERIVEELVMRQIMLAEVAKQGVSLSDTEFAEIKGELAEELPPGTTLESYMAETGTTEAEMREQMAVRKMIMAKAEALAKPTDEEIQKFYDENKEGFAQGESVTASHILIKVDPTDDDAAKAAKRARIEDLRKQALEGADFAELAKANSDCPSASSGGDLGTFGKGQMVPEFEDAAFSQPTGSVGEVVETQFGFHIIKVTDHQQAKATDFSEVKERISDILYSQKQQDAVKEYVDGLRKQADVQRFDKQTDVEADDSMIKLDVEGEEPAVEEAPAAEVAPEAPAADEAVAEAAPADEAAAPAVEAVEEAPEAAPAADEAVAEAPEAAPEAEAAVAPAVEEKAGDASAETEQAPVPASEEKAE